MIALQTNELFSIIDRALDYGYNRAMERTASISSLITVNEAIAIAKNKREVRKALNARKFQTVLKGKRVYIVRESFDKWLLKDEFIEIASK